MVLKEHLLLKIAGLFIFILAITSCKKTTKEEGLTPSSFVVDISKIPTDTISSDNKNIKLDNGVVYLKGEIYSGFIKENYSPNQVKAVFSFLNGKQHGITISYFLDRKIKHSRSYKDGKSFGKHFGYWENGHQKFDFIYNNDEREGLQKQWYESGTPYSFLTFKDDKEDGMQKAWRENGKPYINYQAKDGRRYGLQKSNLCYTLRDGELKTKK